jgi:hypothetical protein
MVTWKGATLVCRSKHGPVVRNHRKWGKKETWESGRGLVFPCLSNKSEIHICTQYSTETRQIGSPCESDARCSLAYIEMLSKSRHKCQLPTCQFPARLPSCLALPMSCPRSSAATTEGTRSSALRACGRTSGLLLHLATRAAPRPGPRYFADSAAGGIRRR